MQKDPVISVLAGALCIAAFGVFVLTISCEMHYRKLQRIQPRAANIQFTQGIITGLATDVLEYSKRNPAVDPLLQQVGLKPPGKPAAKPAAK